MPYLGHAYVKNVFTGDVKFKYNQGFSILSGNYTSGLQKNCLFPHQEDQGKMNSQKAGSEIQPLRK